MNLINRIVLHVERMYYHSSLEICKNAMAADLWQGIFRGSSRCDNIDQYPELTSIIKSQCGPFDEYIKHHKVKYNGLDDFLRVTGVN